MSALIRDYKAPTVREGLLCVLGVSVWLGVTALFIGFRPEHAVIAMLIFSLFYASPATRRLTVALIPFMIFGISYDWMNLLPNYEVNPVDTTGLYETEKSIFGIATADGVLTPNEYFAGHTRPFLDFICGLFYLCWVPVPMLFGVYLFCKGRNKTFIHFALVFLFANFIGFAIYYLHPAAPPWYMASHPGGEVVIGTTGEVAGLGAFDQMTGWHVFEGLYTRNSNVFAAVPSLHSAYTFIAFIYSLRGRTALWTRITLGIITTGIWFTAVYTSHHYVLDVLGGIMVALVAYFIFEYLLMRLRPFGNFVRRYVTYTSKAVKTV